MRSIKLVRKKGKFIILVVADDYIREYEETDLKIAEARVEKLKLMLNIK